MIIIPTYNERKNIRPLVGRIRQVLPQIPILFVDDSSKDGTGDEIKSLQQTDSNIRLLTRPGKAGFASAYLDAFKLVLKEISTDFIMTMDADLSHPPEKIPELLEAAKGNRIAIGSRYIQGGRVSNWKLRRRILSRMANLYARILTGLSVKDVTAGFMVIPTEKLRQLDLNSIHNRGYAFLMELKVRLSELGSELAEVPIIFEERKEGESKISKAIILEGIKYPFRIFTTRQVRQSYPAWLIFFISLGVYVATLPRTIFFGDSPEFMATAATLGVAHPPGYPLYAVIGKLFTFLPFGNLEFKIGFFSALSASLTLIVFYFLFLKLTSVFKSANKNLIRWVGFVTSLSLGFSSLFWSQAIMAKVYAPLLLITLLIIWLVVRFWETKQSSYLVTSLFLFGLGSGLHQMILLFSPLLVFAFLIYAWKIENIFKYRFDIRPLVIGVLLFLIGLSIYVYLPLREKIQGEFYDFAKIFRTEKPGDSFGGFKNYVFRTDYADYGGKFVIKDKISFLNSFVENLYKQFYWLLILLPVGLGALGFYSKRFFMLTAGLFLLNVVGIILLRSSSWNYENEFLHSFYYLPAVSMTVLWIGFGLATILNFVAKKIPQKILMLICVLVLIFPIILFKQNFTVNNLSKFNFVDEYTKKILESLPVNSLLLAHFPGANSDTVVFGLHYQQIVKHLRPDVTILTISDIHPEVDRKVVAMVYGLNDPKLARYNLLNYTLKSQQYQDRPIYTTYLIDDLSDKQLWSETSNGLVYKFSPFFPPTSPAEYYALELEKDLKVLESDMFGQDLLSQYFYTQAAYWAGKKDLHNAQDNFIKGIKYDYKLMGIDQKSFIYYRERIFGKL